MPEAPEPGTVEEAIVAITGHREAIVRAQHAVLQRKMTMAEYNATYKEHLDAIHRLEALLPELQAREGAAGKW